MSDTQPIAKSDRFGLYASVVFAAIGIANIVTDTIARLREVAPGHDIPVLVRLAGESAQLPLGPGGSAVAAQVETVTVIVADPAPATLFALWAQPIVAGLSWSVGLVLAAMFCVRLARAQVFTRGTYRLTYLAAGVLTVGWFVGGILTNMTTNGALSAISDYSYDAVTFDVGWKQFLGVLVLAAVGVALQVGERLQRDTDGLV